MWLILTMNDADVGLVSSALNWSHLNQAASLAVCAHLLVYLNQIRKKWESWIKLRQHSFIVDVISWYDYLSTLSLCILLGFETIIPCSSDGNDAHEQRSNSMVLIHFLGHLFYLSPRYILQSPPNQDQETGSQLDQIKILMWCESRNLPVRHCAYLCSP